MVNVEIKGSGDRYEFSGGKWSGPDPEVSRSLELLTSAPLAYFANDWDRVERTCGDIVKILPPIPDPDPIDPEAVY